MRLTKFVPVTRSGIWLDMFATLKDAIAACQRHDVLIEVQQWDFYELPDGTHGAPSKTTRWIKALKE
jgi:hypothetical protein